VESIQPVCGAKYNGIKVVLSSEILTLTPMTKNQLIYDRASNSMAKEKVTSIPAYCAQGQVKRFSCRVFYPTVTGQSRKDIAWLQTVSSCKGEVASQT
jgi:hypothetical protein